MTAIKTLDPDSFQPPSFPLRNLLSKKNAWRLSWLQFKARSILSSETCHKLPLPSKVKYPQGPWTASIGKPSNKWAQTDRWSSQSHYKSNMSVYSNHYRLECEYNRIIKRIVSHRQSLWTWSVGGLMVLVCMTAAHKLSLNFLIGLVRLIRPPCRVQMVTVTEWNQHPAKIWLGGFGLGKQIMVVGAGGTHNEWAESFVFPPYFSSIIHKQL